MMKSPRGVIAIPVLLLVATICVNAAGLQNPQRSAEELDTIEGTVNTLYRSISFYPGNTPDWDFFKSLFIEEAIFIMPARLPEVFTVYTLDGFVDLFKQDIETHKMDETGFHEKVADNQVTAYGNIAHCFVDFEGRLKPEDERLVAKGKDSISMVKKDGRWWIVSITTAYSRPEG